MATTRCYQDGADFYKEADDRHLATAPFKVADFDCGGAERARAWFMVWAEATWGIVPDFA